jgi:hypothetical protein
VGQGDIVLAQSSLDGCQARPGSDGQIRCKVCRLVWDRDEGSPCPRVVRVESPPLVSAKFVSALAPDIFSGMR